MTTDNTTMATETAQNRELLLEVRWLAGEISKLAGLAKMGMDTDDPAVKAIYNFAESVKDEVNKVGASGRFSDYQDRFGVPSEDMWAGDVSEFFTSQLSQATTDDLPKSLQVVGIFTVPEGTFTEDYGVDTAIYAPILEDGGVFNPGGIIPESVLTADDEVPDVSMEDKSLDTINLDLSGITGDEEPEAEPEPETPEVNLSGVDMEAGDVETVETETGETPEHIQNRTDSVIEEWVDFDTLTPIKELPPTADGIPEGMNKKYELAFALKVENPARTFEDVAEAMEERFGESYSTTSVGNAMDRFLSDEETDQLKDLAREARRTDPSDEKAAEATQETPESETTQDTSESTEADDEPIDGSYQDMTSLASHIGAWSHYNLDSPNIHEVADALENYGVRMPEVDADHDYELHRGGTVTKLTRQDDGEWTENGAATTTTPEEYEEAKDSLAEKVAKEAQEATDKTEAQVNIPSEADLVDLLGNENVAQNYRAMILKLAGQATGEGVSEETRTRKLEMARFITEGLSGDRTWE